MTKQEKTEQNAALAKELVDEINKVFRGRMYIKEYETIAYVDASCDLGSQIIVRNARSLLPVYFVGEIAEVVRQFGQKHNKPCIGIRATAFDGSPALAIVL